MDRNASPDDIGTPRDLGASLRERAVYRFGLVFVLLLITFAFLAAGSTAAWARLVTVVLQGATLVVALSASGVHRRLVRIAVVVAVLAVVATAATLGISGDEPAGAVAVLNALFVAVAPIAIAWSILRRRVVDVQTVLGALCIYVLLGMFWAFTFTAVGTFGSQSFFAQVAHPSSADYVYFSYVTQTTVGYGDLTAIGHLGRALAVLDALLGQIYLVTVIALLVSRLGRGPLAARVDPSSPPDATPGLFAEG